ncbi:hypothetical protein DIE18_15830 [Burkholderia sp. Bp9125]|nr:hypothetical protein DIE18_15830 [Burkholderia sp. Bp9125]
MRVCLVSTGRMMVLDEHGQDTVSQLRDELDEAQRAVANGTARVRGPLGRTPLGSLQDALLYAYLRLHPGELQDLVQAQHHWLIDKGVLSDRDAALSTLRTALGEMIARDYVDAQLIDRYVDALPGGRATPGACHEQVERWLQTRPGDTPVRGWIADGCSHDRVRFAAHSLVRTATGELLDVTYVGPGNPQYFVAHPAAAGEFFTLVLGEVHGEPPVPYIDLPRPDKS